MSHNDYKLYLIENLRSIGIDYKLYDLSLLVHNETLNSEFADITLDKFSDFIDAIDNSDYIFLNFALSYKHIKYIKAIIKSKKIVVRIVNGKIPAPRLLKRMLIKEVFKPNKLTGFIKNKYISELQKKIRYINFTCGCNDNGHPIPSYEYENIIALSNSLGPPRSDYHLFIDQNVCYHRDLAESGNWLISNPDEYYSSMRRFFDLLELNTNKEVVVALHPRSNLSQCNFGDRRVVISDTAQMVYNADMVIAHYSTALHYAVILNKKLLLVTVDQMSEYGYCCTLPFSEELNIPILNIDTAECKTILNHNFNTSQYSKYLNKYIIDEVLRNSYTPSSSIVLNELMSVFNHENL